MIEFRQNAPIAPPRHAAPSCRQLAVHRIADIICEMQGSNEPVTEEALAARNIPPDVAQRFRAEALEAARRRFVKRG